MSDFTIFLKELNMLDYLNSNKVSFDPKTKLFTINSRLRLDYTFKGMGNAPDLIFNIKTPDKLVFHYVFLYEVIALFKAIVKVYRTKNKNMEIDPRLAARFETASIGNIQEALKDLESIEASIEEERIDWSLDFRSVASKFKYKPRPFQQELFNHYGEYKRDTGYRGLLVDAGVGSGKTFMGLAIAEMLQSDVILVITPLPALQKVWVTSIKDSPKNEGLYLKPEKNLIWTTTDNGMYNKEKFLIVHYEALSRYEEYFKSIKGKAITVIVDESHNFADTKSSRTAELLNLINLLETQHLILLSGTPIKSYSTEIINLFRLVDANVKDNVYERLYSLYKSPIGLYKNTLQDRYKGLSFRIEKKEIGLDPLEKIYVPVTLKNGNDYTLSTILKKMRVFMETRLAELNKLRDKYLETYDACLKMALENGYPKGEYQDYKDNVNTVIHAYETKRLMFISKLLAEVNKEEKKIEKYLLASMIPGWRECKTIVKYPLLKVIGECLGGVLLRARINCHLDIARALDYDDILSTTVKDTIVFSQYVEVCQVAYERCKQLGFQPVDVYGETTKILNKQVDLFKSKKQANPLIATYKSLSTAVPLINADRIITLDLPYRMYIFDQAVGRAWRQGQDSIVKVYMPVLDTGDEPNINQRNFDIIKFFNDEVERLTGYKQTMNVDETVTSIMSGFIPNLESIEGINISDCNIEATTPTFKHKIFNW